MVLSQLAGIGFKSIDIRPFDFTTDDALRYIEELGLTVTCMGLSFGIPEGTALESADDSTASSAMDYTLQSLAYAAETGATTAYVVPGQDGSPESLSRYGKALTRIAERASTLSMKICIEHFPGRALPTVTSTLDFIRAIDHPNLYILFDIGHGQMTDEDPADAIHAAGPQLGYMHLDDNDGRNDLHLALLDGVLTENILQRTFKALDDVVYAGPVSLELHPDLPDPLTALRQSREIVLRAASP